MVLTKAGSILGPIATVLGYVMDILFRFTSSLRRVQRRSVHHSVYDRNENTDDTAHDQTAENHKTHVCHESGDPGDPEEV